MALAPIRRLQIVCLDKAKMALLSALQEAGTVEIEELNPEGFPPLPSPSQVEGLDRLLGRIKALLDVLMGMEKKGFLERLSAQRPQVALSEKVHLLQTDLTPILECFEELGRTKDSLFGEVRSLDKEAESLAGVAGLSLPLNEVAPTEHVDMHIGTVPVEKSAQLESWALEEAAWCDTIARDKRGQTVIVFTLKKDRPAAVEKLGALGFSPYHFSDAVLRRATDGGTARDVAEALGREIADKASAAQEVEAQIHALSVHKETLMRAYDVLSSERTKLLSTRMLGLTDRTVFLEGWVAASEVDRLSARLRDFADVADVSFRSPREHENPPVILRNRKPFWPFEIITKLYGLPKSGTLDPTPSLSPFFFLFVGLAVSEAGYGAVVALLTGLFLVFGRPKGGAAQFLKLMFLLGVSNVIFGTLVGGWFGFPIKPLLVLDPLKEPVRFLILTLILGFVQVWVGTFLNMRESFRHKAYAQATALAGWLLLLPGLVLYALTGVKALGILALVGAAAVILFAAPKRNPVARFFGGLYGLYDISKYVGDILSYSRLLALGLSTSVIAMVVNTLCATALKIPWVGWLAAAVIFAGGHLFNLAISFLGGFVHSMRLQFVEYFSKFFQAGGRPFRPFALESRYTDFVESR